MRPELKKLLFAKLYHGQENPDKRINCGDRRKICTYVAADRRTGVAARRTKVCDLLTRIQDKYHQKFKQ